VTPAGVTPSGAGLAKFTRVMRFCGPGATGEFAPKYATSASRSISPPSESVHWVNVENPSPPVARKLFMATR
jgi:hypothetical protein